MLVKYLKGALGEKRKPRLNNPIDVSLISNNAAPIENHNLSESEQL